MTAAENILERYEAMIDRQKSVVRNLSGDIHTLCRNGRRSKAYVTTACNNKIDAMRVSLEHIKKLTNILSEKINTLDDPDLQNDILTFVMQTQGYCVPNVLTQINECAGIVTRYEPNSVVEEIIGVD